MQELGLYRRGMPCVTIAALQSPDRSISCLFTYISAIYLLSQQFGSGLCAAHSTEGDTQSCGSHEITTGSHSTCQLSVLDSSFKITVKQEDTHSQRKNRGIMHMKPEILIIRVDARSCSALCLQVPWSQLQVVGPAHQFPKPSREVENSPEFWNY